MDCSEIFKMLDSRRVCEQSQFGAKVLTECLYPSADPVYVHISKWGDGFRVTDGGDLLRNVIVHGRDDRALEVGLEAARKQHALSVQGAMLFAEVPNADWLMAAVRAIANGAALAANVAVDHEVKKAERGLVNDMYKAVEQAVPAQRIAKEYEWRGKSGKTWKVDLAVLGSDRPLLMKAVTPHHNSISSNYTAFGDIGAADTNQFCVFRKRLAEEDSALIRQVATLVPISALTAGTRQAMMPAGFNIIDGAIGATEQ